MTVNSASGLVKIGSAYINPQNVAYVYPSGDLTYVQFNNDKILYSKNESAENIAKAMIKAEQTGNIIDLEG